MKRHQKALGIMEGARNVRAITKSLAEAAEEAAGEGIGAEHDAAVRLMVHRLAKLCNTEAISYGYDPVTLSDTYCQLMRECRTRAVEENVVRVLEPPSLLQPEWGGRPESHSPDPPPEFAKSEVVSAPDIEAEVRRGTWRSIKERLFSARST